MHSTRIFMNGASQAVRLPAEYRFEKPEVRIARIGSLVVIFPAEDAWSLFESVIGSASADFARPAQVGAGRSSGELDPTPSHIRMRSHRKPASVDRGSKPGSKPGLKGRPRSK